MKLIDVQQGIAQPGEGAVYPVDVADLAAEGVRLVVWPDDGGEPWVEREPFRGREHDAELLAIAESLMSEAQAQHDAPPPPPTLAEAKAAKRREINAAYAAELAAITDDYPDVERLTWDKQEREARAWADDNTASTPLLDGIAAARGLSLSELVSRVIAKADAWIDASGAATGHRQALEDAIDAAETVEDVEAVAW